ncbi:MAG: DNA repair protein RadA [Candidatus Electryonea clarkiae]|nr:DNA repair protein RadA [Candidatus Electryonea clarkiae]MDP8288714.1 DNA repair protein RadA [Candidatus Electryonea clarkiae]
MPATKTQFVCQSCGSTQPRWLGRCPSCGAWNTFAEEQITPRSGRSRGKVDKPSSQPQVLADLVPDQSPRLPGNLPELDRVLGGGFVKASSVLIGGDPGVGKSTLLLQAAASVASKGCGVLYVSAEEAPAQIRLRSDRLDLACYDLQVLGESDNSEAIKWAEKLKPGMVVVDSIQTLRRTDLESAPGTVTQVREVASSWTDWAKQNESVVVLIGHVTKEGAIAGPRVVEHLVDAVLLFEGDHVGDVRILRTLKNRFGPTGELGVFEMSTRGLKGVENPSKLFLSQGGERLPGVAVSAVINGSRPMLIELQALVTRSFFSAPQRNATGVDQRRLSLWIAVLEKRVGLVLAGQDVFLNAAGGLRLEDAAADLAAVTAIASSLKDQPVRPDTVLIGEVGLTGEVRAVGSLERRLSEAAHLAFKRAVIPATGWKNKSFDGIEVIPVGSLDEALEVSLADR